MLLLGAIQAPVFAERSHCSSSSSSSSRLGTSSTERIAGIAEAQDISPNGTQFAQAPQPVY